MKDFPFIDNTDLPSDPNGSLGKARRELTRAYNYNRNSPEKMQLLAETLLYVVDKITRGLGTPDSAEVQAYRNYTHDQVIANTAVTPGFTPKAPKSTPPKVTKPKRAAKRTTKRTK